MNSMTGYSYNEQQNDQASFSIELKSYNNRYLDVFVNLPSYLNPLEPEFRTLISSKVSRGRVELNMRYHELSDSLEMSLDEDAVEGYLNILNRLRDKAAISEPVTLSNLQQVEGLIRTDRKTDLDAVREMAMPILEKTLDSFLESRHREGQATLDDILAKLKRIESAVDTVSASAQSIEERVKENLVKRFQEVLGDEMDLQRVYTETAVLLVKYSVSEELERLKTHFAAFREMAAGGEPVGKKLDFLAQEMNREINTIGSKNIIAEVSQAVVDAKDALEQIREQLRNVE